MKESLLANNLSVTVIIIITEEQLGARLTVILWGTRDERYVNKSLNSYSITCFTSEKIYKKQKKKPKQNKGK